METQLRIYRIAEGHLDDFVAAWTAGVLPLRRAFGFESEGWTAADGRFVWLISYDGPETFDEVDRRYYASPERRSLDPDPAQWIIDNETVNLVATVSLDGATKD